MSFRRGSLRPCRGARLELQRPVEHFGEVGARGSGASRELLGSGLRIPSFIDSAVPVPIPVPASVERGGLDRREDVGDVLRRVLLRVARREASRGRGGDVHD